MDLVLRRPAGLLTSRVLGLDSSVVVTVICP